MLWNVVQHKMYVEQRISFCKADAVQEITVVDEFVTMKPKNKHMKRYFTEVLECDPILGPGLLRAIGLFVHAGRKKSPFKQDKYATLAEYLDYRRHDIAKP